jgi:hypothetical protein
MAYDQELANRLRDQLADEPGLSEKAMFGGLAFLINGNMAVSASGRGGLMVRVDPEASDDALARAHTSLLEMRGRQMRGWICVAAEGVRTKRELDGWVRRGVAFARALPPKR